LYLHRLPFDPNRHIMAEHGFSCLVRVFSGKQEHAVLLDTGLSRECMAWNARQPGISLAAIEAVVLSHGHFDHIGGLSFVFCGAGHQVPLVVHPDAFLQRRTTGPKGMVKLPDLDAVELKKSRGRYPAARAAVHARRGPSARDRGSRTEDLRFYRASLQKKDPGRQSSSSSFSGQTYSSLADSGWSS
jgi:7,8-dihydropterin-6-yl-methyl-4-(beta-D-ribofuranosyl)aminobenzene 5'-phosphate synthase